MQLSDLIYHIRFQVDDLVQPYLFLDTDITNYITEAEIEACKRKRLLHDMVSIATDNTNLYALPDNVWKIERVKMQSQGYQLYETDMLEMDLYNNGWQSKPASKPMFYLLDVQTRHISLYPASKSQDNILIYAHLLPSSVLQTNPIYWLSFCDWVLYRLFSKKDTVIFDSVKATDFLTAFTSNYGETLPIPNAENKKKPTNK